MTGTSQACGGKHLDLLTPSRDRPGPETSIVGPGRSRGQRHGLTGPQRAPVASVASPLRSNSDVPVLVPLT